MKSLLSPGGSRQGVMLSLAAVAAMLAALAAPASARTVPAHPKTLAKLIVTVRPGRAGASPASMAHAGPDGMARPAAQPNAPITAAECKNAYNMGWQTDQGWAKSRFAACTVWFNMVWTKAISNDNGLTWQPVGHIGFDITDINQPEKGTDRIVDHTWVVDNIHHDGDISYATLTFQTKCFPSDGLSGAGCYSFGNPPITTQADNLAQLTSTSQFVSFTMYPGSYPGGVGYDYTRTYVTGTLNQPNNVNPPPATVTTTPTGFRCDSASYFSTPGCVIDWAPSPVLVYDSVNYPLVAPVAQHIYDAQHGLLYTRWGEPGYPLTRDTNSGDRTLNNQTACRYFVPPDNVNTSCDEYPLESTYEGAYFQPDFSTRGVPPNANSSQGGITNAFYSSQRILDQDAFGVNVILPNGTYSW